MLSRVMEHVSIINDLLCQYDPMKLRHDDFGLATDEYEVEALELAIRVEIYMQKPAEDFVAFITSVFGFWFFPAAASAYDFTELAQVIKAKVVENMVSTENVSETVETC